MATNQTPFGIPGLWSPSSAGSTRQLPRVSLGTRRMTARHGSGAMDTTTRGRVRAASRENSRESRRRPAPNVASGPVGPATAAEWNDIADGLRERISRAEKAVALHAHTIGQLQTEATQQSNVQPSVVKRVEALAADMDRRFIEGGEKVMQRVNRLEGELKLLYEHVRSFGQATDNGSLPTPIPGVPTYRYSTPPPRTAESPTGQNSENFGNDNDYDDNDLRQQQQYSSSNNYYDHSPGATAGADTEDFGAPPQFGLNPNPFAMPATAQDRWDPRVSVAHRNQRPDNWSRQPPPNFDPRFQRPPPTFDPRAPGPAQGHWAPPHGFCPSQMPPTPNMMSAANHCHATAVAFNAQENGYKIRKSERRESRSCQSLMARLRIIGIGATSSLTTWRRTMSTGGFSSPALRTSDTTLSRDG